MNNIKNAPETGQTYVTKNYGPVTVLGPGRKERYSRVRFLRTGHEDEFRNDAIRRGEIRDKYAVTLCGVGIIGNVKTKGKYHPYYVIWHGIINRCYNVQQQLNKHRRSYLDVEVCDRWKTFEYFYEDCRRLPGFDEAKFLAGELVMDKDIKQRHSDHKIYAPEFCQWVTPAENCKIQDAQQRPFIAHSPDGRVYHTSNITAFAREHGLKRHNVSSALHSKSHLTQGWKFIYEEIV